ncbi:DUF7678 domain-containing protein [Adlercreutzia caecimuris]|uniref:DUF7678 domain-containing protein n=1 Tax=Adlercreutzia caecimuris TaxID=671266 RepID=A0A4S4G257_9ACTN|nr:hypothetical protein [Adlercreutzia caecimuris]THG36878.1 hypothetical protein E5986_08225 [Adlercreutzia caecimuris]
MEIGARNERGWVSGSTDEGYCFNAKVYDLPSVFGIPTERFPEGGNVSKLHISDAGGREVYAYERGLHFAADGAMALAFGIAAELEAIFCKEAV